MAGIMLGYRGGYRIVVVMPHFASGTLPVLIVREFASTCARERVDAGDRARCEAGRLPALPPTAGAPPRTCTCRARAWVVGVIDTVNSLARAGPAAHWAMPAAGLAGAPILAPNCHRRRALAFVERWAAGLPFRWRRALRLLAVADWAHGAERHRVLPDAMRVPRAAGSRSEEHLSKMNADLVRALHALLDNRALRLRRQFEGAQRPQTGPAEPSL
ncbi:hypothetical protein T492DRAFT_886849 [Pavlovales sp. CCMP2436]|nr:hypothetical protein T492DRAFT_886849 [Pavlovales sp. CCMP2436]